MSTSNNRQKSAIVNVRCTPEQHLEIKAKAERAGMTVSSFLLECVLDAPPPRKRRSLPIEKALLSKAISLLGRSNITNNTTQIYDHLNSVALSVNRGREADIDEIKSLIIKIHDHITAIRNLIFEALGRDIK